MPGLLHATTPFPNRQEKATNCIISTSRVEDGNGWVPAPAYPARGLMDPTGLSVLPPSGDPNEWLGQYMLFIHLDMSLQQQTNVSGSVVEHSRSVGDILGEVRDPLMPPTPIMEDSNVDCSICTGLAIHLVSHMKN